MKKIRDISLKSKLIVLMLIIAFFAMLMLGAILIFNDYKTKKEIMKNELVILSKIIGYSLEAPLVFNGEKEGIEVLKSLSQNPAIVAGILFDKNKEVFAKYERKQSDKIYSLTDTDINSVCYEKNGFLLRTNSVKQGNNILGFLLLKSELSSIYTYIFNYAVKVIIISFILSVLVYFIVSKIHIIISKPINSLLKVMKNISDTKDYTARIKISNNDEIGAIINEFNNMISQIEERDNQLNDLNVNLEDKIKTRTIELAKTADEATKANKAKSEFLANMSHEIRTPMNGVKGMCDALLRKELTAGQKDCALTIKKSSDDLLVIINDILDFSKVEAGKLDIHQSIFNLKELMNNLYDIFIMKTDKKNIELQLYISNEVADCYIGDELRLKQVLINLINNAIKFTKTGFVKIEVLLINTTESNDILFFKVIDSGIGMNQNIVDKLFEAFTQADSSTTKEFGGTGLGLTISKRLIDLMDGELEVNSIPNKGSEFFFNLPLQKTEQVLKSDKKINHRYDKTFKAVNNKLIVLVEDNEINAKVAISIFEDLGFSNIIHFINGKVLLDNLNKILEASIIFMDCQMPEMNGYDATKGLRKISRFSKVPIIAMTANAMKGDQEKCLAAGMSDYISKPIDSQMVEYKLKDAFYSLEDTQILQNLEDKKQQPILDYNTGIERVAGNKNLFINLLEIFKKTHSLDAYNIKEAFNAKDMKKAKDLSHNLKGCSSSIGLNNIDELSTKINEKLVLNNENGLEEDINALVDAVNQGLEEIQQYLKSVIV